MRCIIPAAGFGTRMGMKPGQSKEMLPSPENKYNPIISYALTLCKMFNMEPLVVTRKEKVDLRQYLFNEQVKFIDIEVEGEWNETILKSREHWHKENLLLLPDTRFSSLRVIENIQRGLSLGNNAVMALHRVPDPSNWGIVTNNYTLMEKPEISTGPQLAWGLIGFRNTYGQKLFSNVKYLELENVGFTYLDYFKDITRGSK